MTAPEQRATTLGSGVRVVTEAMPAVRSAALGFFIGTGSSTEDEPVAGWSHLLEHMIFRGTARYESLEIDQIFDAMGAELNAGTGKDLTTVETRVLDENLEQAFDVLADMVWRPRVTADDLAQEREIVIEEIAMYEDDPQELVFDVLGGAVFGEHALGRPIIGSRETVAAADADALRSFHATRYAPGDLVVAAAGSVDHDALVALVEAAQADEPSGRRAPGFPPAPERSAPARRFIARTTEQYHLTLGGHGVARDDDRRFALRVLDMILGGTSSSRLFQAIREERGLAYSIFSFTSQHVGTGQVGIYLGTRPDNVEVAAKVLGEELERLVQDGVQADELQRARDHVRARLALDLESTESRMTRIGTATLSGLLLLSIDDLMERISDVSAEDVDALARELFDPRVLSAAGIGPDEDVFRRGLEQVAPDLAQAA